MKAAIQIILLFLLPIALLVFRVIPVEFRGWLLVANTFGVVWIVIQERWTWKQLGVRSDNFFVGLPWYLVGTGAGALTIVAVAVMARRPQLSEWWLLPHFRLLLFIPVSFLQELSFRSFLVPKLRFFLRRKIGVIIANAALFSAMHIIFPAPEILVPLTFAGGLLLTALYLRFQNLLLAALSHMALNVFFVVYCFGTFRQSCIST